MVCTLWSVGTYIRRVQWTSHDDKMGEWEGGDDVEGEGREQNAVIFIDPYIKC